MASHLELLASHGLHVALLANGELVGHGVTPGVVLGPGEVLPILLDLRDDLEITALFNRIAGEPWPKGTSRRAISELLTTWGFGKEPPSTGQATLTVTSTNFSSTMSQCSLGKYLSKPQCFHPQKMDIIRPIFQGWCKD